VVDDLSNKIDLQVDFVYNSNEYPESKVRAWVEPTVIYWLSEAFGLREVALYKSHYMCMLRFNSSTIAVTQI
jgi:hypothetical protein